MKVARTVLSPRCKGIVKDNRQCEKPTDDPSGFCKWHRNGLRARTAMDENP